MSRPFKTGDRLLCVSKSFRDAESAHVTIGRVYIARYDEMPEFSTHYDRNSNLTIVMQDDGKGDWYFDTRCFILLDDTECACEKCQKGG